jgi:hypothetical protein
MIGKSWNILSLFIIFIVALNILYVSNIANFLPRNENYLFNQHDTPLEDYSLLPESSSDLDEILKFPFLDNFSDIWNFFNSNYVSNLNMPITTYYRNGDEDGTIIDDLVYPVDNLYLYKSLLKHEINATNTYNTYLELKQSPFWYEGNGQTYDYGFIGAVNASNNKIFDDQRYLIDNLVAINLLIENIGDQITSINIGGNTPADSIIEIFNLVNSTIFWDNTYQGFYDHNSTTDKYTESNLYAILTCLRIKSLFENLNINSQIKDRAKLLANMTMTELLDNDMWDQTNYGFKYYAKQDWSGETGSDFKYLKTNALGIITLLEYWLESGMQSDSVYLNYTIALFDKMDTNMWSPNIGGTYNAYEFSRDPFWGGSGANRMIDLEGNALMLYACARFFEVTGNFTYYERAWELYETLENQFYDGSVNAYRSSISNPYDVNKDFHANLILSNAYIKAYELYNKTSLDVTFNVSQSVPDYIFDQDTMNVTSIYSYQGQIQFYNTTTEEYEIKNIVYEIEDGNITYLFKTPNDGELFDTVSLPIVSSSTILLYNITNLVSIGNNYSLWVYANSSMMGTAFTLEHFNVVSGLVTVDILGLPSTLYQGPTLNVTLQVNNTRNENIFLNVSMESEDIYNETQLVFFENLVLTNITFNLTAQLDANPGSHQLRFSFSEGTILYLEITEPIEIGFSFNYQDFLYDSRTVKGGKIQLSLKVNNFLPNSSQFLNVSFTGQDLVYNVLDEVFLTKNEIKTLYYELQISDLIIANSTEILMEIKKGSTVFYNKSFHIQIVPKFEILRVSFPSSVPQGKYADFILEIRNNQDFSEPFSLWANGEQISTNLAGLAPGDNKIIAQVLPTIFPYDFQTKTYTFTLKDAQGQILAQYYYEIIPELTTFNLMIFYILPILIPIVILLFYKNKEIQHKLLRR